ncbi:MAG: AMP-binding protein, partial [Gemmatimonadaceae bacterium]
SGSTGKPKGVMLTHGNATSYVDWCGEVLAPSPSDRFSSHAPFHFDLSILDLYVPLATAATVVLIDAEQGKEPLKLAALIADRALTVWYSTPTVLSLLSQFGKLEQYDFSSVRMVIFAGEVFPIKHLRAVKRHFPSARFFNLYGPTETNVCTYYEIPDTIPDDRTDPYPIGTVCSHFRARVIDEEERDVQRGELGELVVRGAGTMRGYWNLPERSALAFQTDAEGNAWYRTGDIVIEDSDGVFAYVGRRDRMVKRRGYRVELGDIEAGLYRHPHVKEAAVVALKDGDAGVTIRAFVCMADDYPRSVIEMKRFCAEVMPGYMVPDTFVFRNELPRTSTDKTDYQQLLQLA